MLLYRLSVLLVLALFVGPWMPLIPSGTLAGSANTASSVDGLLPLPKGCFGRLPPGADDAACCLFGYVLIDGRAVAGAKLTITSAHGTREVWTERDPSNPEPYYRLSLSAAPLLVTPNDTITITAAYSGRTRTTTHTVLAGGQQVDVVLPRNQPQDYVFERQIWAQPAAAKFNEPTDIAVDPAGRMYVVDHDNARVQVFTIVNGTVNAINQWGTLGDQPRQFVEPQSIAADRWGRVFVTDSGNHRVQRFSITGDWETSWGRLGDDPGELNTPSGIAVDSVGQVYVTDRANHRVQKFTKDGSYLGQWGGQGSAAGQFNDPQGIAIDRFDQVYVADSGNHRIQQFTSSGAYLGQWGDAPSVGTPVDLSIDHVDQVYVVDAARSAVLKFTTGGTLLGTLASQGTAANQLQAPQGVAVDGSGRVLIADTGHHRIQLWSQAGAYVQNWGRRGCDCGQFANPQGIAVDSANNLFVADSGNRRVQLFDAASDQSGEPAWTFWGPGGVVYRDFLDPRAVALDQQGYVYVTNTGHHRVQKFDRAGTMLVSYSSPGTSVGQLQYPSGVAVDASNTIFVADTGNHRIQRRPPAGPWQLVAGAGSGPGQFNAPRGLAIDSSDTLFIADTGNHRIQRRSASGQWQVFGGPGSGPGQFNAPEAVAVDANGNIFVADTGNHRIQKLSPTGSWLASWGASGGAAGQMQRPTGIAVGADGKVYVTDSDHNRIQIFRPMTASQPHATIVAASTLQVTAGTPITFWGSGSDSDATPALSGAAPFEWTLDGSATPFATTATAQLTTTGLAPGTHTTRLRVHDTEGMYSEPQTISIEITGQPTTQEWTFLLYLAGDSGAAISAQLTRALQQVRQATSNPHVRVVALLDGSGPNNTTRYIQQPNGQFVEEALGEVNMGDPQTLIDFVRWGKQQAPAAHYYLAIADHANGLDGIAWDLTATPVDYLSNADLGYALATITDQGTAPLDILHLDSCLMGLLENAYQLRGTTRYLITSQNLAWSVFAYQSYIATVSQTTQSAALTQSIVTSYAQQVTGYPYTIAAWDLTAITPVVRATHAVASALTVFGQASPANQATLRDVRNLVQKFDSDGSLHITTDDEYIDLDHWAELIQQRVTDQAVVQAVGQLRTALDSFVVYEQHASGTASGVPITLTNARGLAIYYPAMHQARTYDTYVSGFVFPSDTAWDEFLAVELAALPFNPVVPAPQPVEPLATTP